MFDDSDSTGGPRRVFVACDVAAGASEALRVAVGGRGRVLVLGREHDRLRELCIEGQLAPPPPLWHVVLRAPPFPAPKVRSCASARGRRFAGGFPGRPPGPWFPARWRAR